MYWQYLELLGTKPTLDFVTELFCLVENAGILFSLTKKIVQNDEKYNSIDYTIAKLSNNYVSWNQLWYSGNWFFVVFNSKNSCIFNWSCTSNEINVVDQIICSKSIEFLQTVVYYMGSEWKSDKRNRLVLEGKLHHQRVSQQFSWHLSIWRTT